MAIPENIEDRIKKIILPLAAGISIGLGGMGCGTTLHTQKDGVWYTCNTLESYPAGHPCYEVVEEYKVTVAARSSCSSSSDDYDIGRGDRPGRGEVGGSGGKWVCPTGN